MLKGREPKCRAVRQRATTKADHAGLRQAAAAPVMATVAAGGCRWRDGQAACRPPPAPGRRPG